ncbi:MAG: hypothetical protein OXR82_14165 [Gammaproteobacteria bacterium]|nr:hypothetical protein [Gammaproteobacteria bacterium]
MAKFFGAGVGTRNETDDTLVPVGRKHNSQPRVAVHQASGALAGLADLGVARHGAGQWIRILHQTVGGRLWKPEETMARKKKNTTEREVNELLDSLMEDRSPEDLTGGGGLLDVLTKRVMERVLEANSPPTSATRSTGGRATRFSAGLGGFDGKVIALYARGMTTQEIQGHLKPSGHYGCHPGEFRFSLPICREIWDAGV